MDNQPSGPTTDAQSSTSSSSRLTESNSAHRPSSTLSKVTLLVAVAAIVVAAFAVRDARQARDDLRKLQFALRVNVGVLRSDLDTVIGPFGDLDSLTTKVDDIAEEVATLDGSIKSSGFDVDERIEELRACINLYMQTVGDSGGGRYTYYLC